MSRDKERDAYNPGISEEQIRKAEEMLGGLNVPLSVERRAYNDDFRSGVLIQIGKMDEPIPVMVS